MDGLLGVAGMICLIVSQWIIPENSLRLAPVRWFSRIFPWIGRVRKPTHAWTFSAMELYSWSISKALSAAACAERIHKGAPGDFTSINEGFISQVHRKTIGKPWENMGKPMGKHRKTMGKWGFQWDFRCWFMMAFSGHITPITHYGLW